MTERLNWRTRYQRDCSELNSGYEGAYTLFCNVARLSWRPAWDVLNPKPMLGFEFLDRGFVQGFESVEYSGKVRSSH